MLDPSLEMDMRMLCGLVVGLVTVACVEPQTDAVAPDWNETCAWQVRGRHTGAALEGGLRCPEVRWDLDEGYTRITLEGFGSEVEEIAVSVDQDGVEMWLADPHAEQSVSITDYRQLYTEWNERVVVEAEVLDAHRAAGMDELHFVVATREPGDWDACIEALPRER